MSPAVYPAGRSRQRSTEVIRELYRHLQGTRGHHRCRRNREFRRCLGKLVAGADAVQVYTAFIYQGPALVRRIVRGLEAKVRAAE